MKVTDTINGTVQEYETVEEMYDGIKAMFDNELDELDEVVDGMMEASLRGECTHAFEDYLAIDIEW